MAYTLCLIDMLCFINMPCLIEPQKILTPNSDSSIHNSLFFLLYSICVHARFEKKCQTVYGHVHSSLRILVKQIFFCETNLKFYPLFYNHNIIIFISLRLKVLNFNISAILFKVQFYV